MLTAYLIKVHLIYWTFSSIFIDNTIAANCYLPEGCRIERIYKRDFFEFSVRGSHKYSVIVCDIESDEYEFKFKDLTEKMIKEKCYIVEFEHPKIIFRWLSNNKAQKQLVFNNRFNLTNAVRYFSYFEHFMNLNFWYLNGFDLNMFDNHLNFTNYLYTDKIEFVNSRLDFYHNNKKINSSRYNRYQYIKYTIYFSTCYR